MRVFDSPFGKITLTDERLGHILSFHADVARYVRYFVDTLLAPEHVVPSKHDHDVRICYRTIPRKGYLAVVIKTGNRPFIVTAYLAKKMKRGIL